MLTFKIVVKTKEEYFIDSIYCHYPQNNELNQIFNRSSIELNSKHTEQLYKNYK